MRRMALSSNVSGQSEHCGPPESPPQTAPSNTRFSLGKTGRLPGDAGHVRSFFIDGQSFRGTYCYVNRDCAGKSDLKIQSPARHLERGRTLRTIRGQDTLKLHLQGES